MNSKSIYILLIFIICLTMVFVINYRYNKIKQELQEKENIIGIVDDNEHSKANNNDNLIIRDENMVSKEEILEKQEEARREEYEKNNLGQFRLTAYCDCKKCCGKWSGSPTASGTTPTPNRTIAVDTNIIPFGTKVMINGNVYVAEDTGSAIIGNRIDIYMSDHQDALNFGVQYAEVHIVN